MSNVHPLNPAAEAAQQRRDLDTYTAEFIQEAAASYDIGGVLARQDLEVLGAMSLELQAAVTRLCMSANRLDVGSTGRVTSEAAKKLLECFTEVAADILPFSPEAARVFMSRVMGGHQ